VTVRLGTNTLLGLDPDRIADVLPALAEGRPEPIERPPLWDGRAAERVVDALEAADPRGKALAQAGA
jgi:UDP-N-acetylglucosamine 2-epimerase (non-hydrolysing)